jgi:hypothetical protein
MYNFMCCSTSATFLDYKEEHNDAGAGAPFDMNGEVECVMRYVDATDLMRQKERFLTM